MLWVVWKPNAIGAICKGNNYKLMQQINAKASCFYRILQ